MLRTSRVSLVDGAYVSRSVIGGEIRTLADERFSSTRRTRKRPMLVGLRAFYTKSR
jgi:hypothetical protein